MIIGTGLAALNGSLGGLGLGNARAAEDSCMVGQREFFEYQLAAQKNMYEPKMPKALKSKI